MDLMVSNPLGCEEGYVEQDEQLPPIQLKSAIQLQEVLDTTAVFEIDMEKAELDNHDYTPTYFTEEDLLKCVKSDCLDDDDDDDKENPGRTPFEKIASKMTNVTQDGKVKKREIRPGHGSVVPEAAYVTVHYNAYVEYCDDPYDSTWLRGQPVKFRLNRNYVIPGFDIAIGTMKMNEVAQFLIHPDLGYGKFGCQPRIPPNAELLFEIELKAFQDNAAAEAFETLSLEDRKKADFPTLLKVAVAENVTGNEFFKNGQIGLAITRYRKAVNMLENYHLKDESEEKQQQRLLLKLYVNLGVCYNKQKMSRQACLACRSALNINPKHSKALFNLGRALLTLSDYREAQRCLLAAQKLEPDNEDITNELKKLNQKKNSFRSDEKDFCTRMFKNKQQETRNEENNRAEVSLNFKKLVDNILTEFASNDGKNPLTLPTGLTAQEELCLRQKAEELDLVIRRYEVNGERQMSISKRSQ